MGKTAVDSNAQRAAIRYAVERRGKGVCLGCGTPVPDTATARKEGWVTPRSNHPRCPECEARRKEKYPEMYERRKAQRQELFSISLVRRKKEHESGLCFRCGKPRKGSLWQCERCLALNAATKVRARLARLSDGLCRCGNKPAAGRVQCERCIIKRRERERKRSR
jgi:hypothetical protein